MDSNTNDRPQRRTALVAAELQRYKIDIAALSETRFPLEGSLNEKRAGYTFFWKGLKEEDPRIHGVGFAIRNEILKGLTEMPTGISERLMSIRIPLAKGSFATIISAYGPTVDTDEGTKDQFYDDLQTIIQNTQVNDKLILLGDLNSRVGTDSEVWPGILGKHGIGKMNKNGLRLLSLCAENMLTITNTTFQMEDKYKTTWMHPRSKHWHQIDFVIVRQRDLKDVRITRVMRGANCWTDHRLVVSKMHMSLRPPTQRRQQTTKRLNCAVLTSPEKREELQSILSNELEDTAIDPGPKTQDEIDNIWDQLITKIHQSSLDCLGTVKRRHRDWFDESDDLIKQMLLEKNRAHDAYLSNPTFAALKKR